MFIYIYIVTGFFLQCNHKFHYMSHEPTAKNDFSILLSGLNYTINKRAENKYDINHTAPDSSNFDQTLEKISSGTLQRNITSNEWELTDGEGLSEELVRQIGIEIDKHEKK